MATNRLLAEFVQLNCAPDILGMQLFPNAKEITESMAMFSAVRRFVCDDFSNPEIAMVSVGDGCTPRTAGLFAFRSAWTCFSVDPNLRGATQWEKRIKRLTCITTKVEDMPPKIRLVEYFKTFVVVMCHSHAPIEATIERFPGAMAFVTMPCCVPHSLRRPYIGFEDMDVMSPHRTIKIYAGNGGEYEIARKDV